MSRAPKVLCITLDNLLILSYYSVGGVVAFVPKAHGYIPHSPHERKVDLLCKSSFFYFSSFALCCQTTSTMRCCFGKQRLTLFEHACNYKMNTKKEFGPIGGKPPITRGFHPDKTFFLYNCLRYSLAFSLVPPPTDEGAEYSERNSSAK